MLDTLLTSLTTYFNSKYPFTYFEDGAPGDVDNCIYLIEYSGGIGDSYSANRRVQVNVRCHSNGEAKQLAWQLYKALDETNGDGVLHLSETRFVICHRLQVPFLLDRDAKGRHIYTFNLQLCTPHDSF